MSPAGTTPAIHTREGDPHKGGVEPLSSYRQGANSYRHQSRAICPLLPGHGVPPPQGAQGCGCGCGHPLASPLAAPPAPLASRRPGCPTGSRSPPAGGSHGTSAHKGGRCPDRGRGLCGSHRYLHCSNASRPREREVQAVAKMGAGRSSPPSAMRCRIRSCVGGNRARNGGQV